MSARRAIAPVSDAEIMCRLAKGEIGALGELYDRYQEPVRSFVSRATQGGDDVDDLVHVTFLEAAKSADRYDGRSSCRPWLIGIAVRHLRRRRQAFGRFFAMLTSLRGVMLTSSEVRSPLDARHDVERALARLTEAKRITFLMAEVEGLTCPEIAEALDVPVGTVWTRLHAARHELRDALEERP